MTKLGGAVGTLEGREALQRDQDRLESWGVTSHMKFNKGKCQILHLGQGNPGYTYRWGNERLESSSAERNPGVLVDGKLNMSQQCPGVPQALHCSWSREGLVPLYSVLVQPHLEYCVQFWVPQYIKDIKLLESVQRRATKLMKGLEEKP